MKRIHKTSVKLLSIILTLVFMVGMIPSGVVFADDIPNTSETTTTEVEQSSTTVPEETNSSTTASEPTVTETQPVTETLPVEEPTEPEYVNVYYLSQWSDVYVYMWKNADPDKNNGEFQTVKMEKDSDDKYNGNTLYKYSFNKNEGYDKVIFSNGKAGDNDYGNKKTNNKTADLDLISERIYNHDGKVENLSCKVYYSYDTNKGTVSASADTVIKGGTVNVIATPKFGYYLKSINGNTSVSASGDAAENIEIIKDTTINISFGSVDVIEDYTLIKSKEDLKTVICVDSSENELYTVEFENSLFAIDRSTKKKIATRNSNATIKVTVPENCVVSNNGSNYDWKENITTKLNEKFAIKNSLGIIKTVSLPSVQDTGIDTLEATRMIMQSDGDYEVNEKGWINADGTVKVVVTAKDSNGISALTYYFDNENDAVEMEEKDGNYELVIPAVINEIPFQYPSVTFKATDLCGNDKAVTVDLFIDSKAPNLENVEFATPSTMEIMINTLTFGLFCNTDDKIFVKANDPQVPSGIKECLVLFGADTEDKAQNALKLDIDGDKYSANLPNNVNGPVFVKLTDNAGNISITPVTVNNSNIEHASAKDLNLMVESNRPSVSVSSAKNVSKISGKEFFKNTAEELPVIEFELSDKTSDGGKVSGLNGFKFNDGINVEKTVLLPKKYTDDNLFEITDEQNIQVKVTKIAESNRIYYKVFAGTVLLIDETELNSKDSNYSFSVIAIDNSGNETKSAVVSETIYCDNDKPVITNIEFESNGSINQYKDIIKYDKAQEQYLYFFNADTKMTITANDSFDCNDYSGVSEIKVLLTTDIGNKADSNEINRINNAVINIGSDNKRTIDIPSGFKGFIKAYAIDKVGNEGKASYPNDFINENEEKHKENSAITLEFNNSAAGKIAKVVDADDYVGNYFKGVAQDKSFKQTKSDKLFGNDVSIKVSVSDSLSGIESVDLYTLIDTNDDGKLEDTLEKYHKVYVAKEDSKSFSGKNKGIYSKFDVEYQVKSNDNTYSNSIVVVAVLTDNSGNKTYDYIQFGIDNQKPIVSKFISKPVSGNNSRDNVYQSNTITFTVTERNTDDRAIKNAVITDYIVHKGSKVDPKVTVNKGGKSDNYTRIWNVSVTYTPEKSEWDDCKVTFDTFKDLAHKVSNKKVSKVFKIDTIAPEINFTWSKSVGSYEKESITLTVSITEHNFNSKTDTATANGSSVSANEAHSVDTHTYKYTFGGANFEGDCKYNFTNANDKAGNVSTRGENKNFVVDTYAPRIAITKPNSHIADSITPQYTIQDKYLSDSSYTLQRYFFNDYKKFEKNGIMNKSYTLDNIKDDGYYLLTVNARDKSGNSTTSSKENFIVNRKGTVYVVKPLELVKKMCNVPLKSTEVSDIEILQYNASPFDENSDKSFLKIQRVGGKEKEITNTELSPSEKKDAQNNHFYMRKYIIPKSEFATTGAYKIFSKSADVDGNVANIEEKVEELGEITIDNDNPVITVRGLDEQIISNTKHTITISVMEGYNLKSITLYENDNKLAEATKDELKNGEFSYTFGEGSYNNLRIVAEDLAGNKSELNSGNENAALGLEKITISTNPFVLWFNNTPLFIATVAGVIIVLGAVAFLIIRKRKKSDK